ncbi:unnamed protein product [Owenia fusiformis]|uniref:Uncharacterized protein n=1 Tax=Owenia fusiformis TaxID=6347 RepID=A0A8S4MYC1_OWEFU|nr:unnamed protein product [Owenia fusiformis]
MPKSRKRKMDFEDKPGSNYGHPQPNCILHVNNIQHGNFTMFGNVKGSAKDKLDYILSVRDKIHCEPNDSPFRMEEVCNLIPESLADADLETLGYHRGCYQLFTKNRDRLKCNTSVASNEASTSRPHSPRRRSSDQMHPFPQECIFCQKLEIKISGKTEKCTKFPLFKNKDGSFREPSWKKIEHQALELGYNHLHRLVQGEDLFAREAQSHESCRNRFSLKYNTYKRKLCSTTIDTEQDQKANAHMKAFTAVLSSIQNKVIEENEVVQLVSLRRLYIQELQKNGFPNSDYRGEKLKARIEDHEIYQKISFANVSPGDKGCINYNVIYKSSLTVVDALDKAYKLGSEDEYKDVALLIRGIIQQAYKDSKSLAWPPSAEELIKASEDILPPNLIRFLNFVIVGDGDKDQMHEKTKRIVLSIGQDTSSLQAGKAHSLKINTPETLAPVHIYGRVGPKFPEGSEFTPPELNNEIYAKCIQDYRVWSLARVVESGGEKQLVPGFGGFVSATGVTPPRKSAIDYFTPIHQSFTDYSVIKELLKQSEDATTEVGQEFVLSTFDLGGCMKALPLIWKFPEQYKKHVVTPGPFHTGMNYINMVTGHKCMGSGYSEILMEAELVTSGSLNSVLKGKAYAKAIFCLKTVCEAMERLLIERFSEDESVDVINPMALFELVQTCSREHLDFALKDPSTLTILEKYVSYEDKVRDGHLGKTATFWMSVIDHIRLLLMLQYAVKTNNLALFHKCNGEMADLFFAFDGPNYSRYLVWLDVFLTNIDRTHPGAKELLRNGGIAVARSLIPGSLSGVDKTMAETFIKFAKSTDCPKGGRHRELERSEIKKSEEAVQRTISAILSFTNPFTLTDKHHLYCLASGAYVSPEVEFDVLIAEAAGKAAKDAFIRDRFVNGSSEAQFFEPIKKLKLKTMEASSKTVKLTAPQGKVIQYREQSDLAFLLLIKSQQLDDPLNFDKLMQYPLTPVPHSLGTTDGFFNKTNKAAILHCLMDDASSDDVQYPKDAIHIQDGNALFHELTNLPPTFGAICLKMLDQMVAKKDFVFSTDTYYAESIKAQERQRRGSSQKYILDGSATRKPSDFKVFLANEDNKTQLSELLLRVCGSKEAASRVGKSRKAVIVVGGKAYELKSSDGEVSVYKLVKSRYCEDVTSAFKGKGMVGPLKKLQSHPTYHTAFRKLGNEWSVSQDVMKDIVVFTCLMYGYPRERSVNAVRSLMLTKMVGDDQCLTTKSNVDLSRLPPCRDNLIPHIGRVNHRIAIYKRAGKPNIVCPHPDDPGQGWVKSNGILEPLWSCGPILPPSLIELIEETIVEVEQHEEKGEDEFDEMLDEMLDDMLDDD